MNSLTDDEITLLKLASVKYYHNRQVVFADSPYKHWELLVREALRPIPDEHTRLTNLVLVEESLGGDFDKATVDKSRLHSQLPKLWRQVAMEGPWPAFAMTSF